MRKHNILTAVKETLALHWQCSASTFDRRENTFLVSDKAFFEVLTFGQGAAFRVDASIAPWCRERFGRVAARDIMDGENLYAIETMLRGHGMRLCGEHTRYTYQHPERTPPAPAGFRYALYRGAELSALQAHKGFDNALNYESDVIGIAAFDGDTIAAMAAADNHLEPLWQIGIDTVPAYRGSGLAAHLVKTLTEAIVAEGKIPYYTTWSANLASTRVALSCGFVPTWIGYMAEENKTEE